MLWYDVLRRKWVQGNHTDCTAVLLFVSLAHGVVVKKEEGTCCHCTGRTGRIEMKKKKKVSVERRD